MPTCAYSGADELGPAGAAPLRISQRRVRCPSVRSGWKAETRTGSTDLAVRNLKLFILRDGGQLWLYGDNLNPLEGVDSNAVAYWLDNYCQARPTDRFVDALKAFIQQHPR